MLKLRARRKECVWRGRKWPDCIRELSTRDDICLLERPHRESNLENRSEGRWSECGWTRQEPGRGFQGKMVSPCTDIMVVEMKRSGWISVIFQRWNTQEWDISSGEGPGSVKAISQEFGSPNWRDNNAVNDVGNNESWPGLGVGRGILCSLMEWRMRELWGWKTWCEFKS